jgi:N6-L-threonylcarbamoyladenine synthase
MLILGLESICDDCSAVVVEETGGGPRVLSFAHEGQDALHAPYGGVVPELAAKDIFWRVAATRAPRWCSPARARATSAASPRRRGRA